MQQRINNLMMLLFVSSLFAISCSEDIEYNVNNYGRLSISLSENTSVFKAQSRAVENVSEMNDMSLPSTNNFNLSLINENGETIDLGRLGDYDNNRKVDIGRYTLSASYGSLEEEGYNKAFFKGEAPVHIKRSKVTSVNVEVKLANARIDVKSKQTVKDYFKSVSYKLETSKNATLKFYDTVNKPMFVKPGQIRLIADITKQNGSKASVVVATINVKPQHFYTVEVDVNEGNVGGAKINVEYVDDLEEVSKIIELESDAFSTGIPTFKVKDWNLSEHISLNLDLAETVEGKSVTFTALDGIKSADLIVSSEYLKSLGLPTTINLLPEDENNEHLSKIKELGLFTRGKVGERLMYVDFSKLISNLRALKDKNNVSTFSIVLKDKNDVTTETAFEFSVVVSQTILELPNGDFSEWKNGPMYGTKINKGGGKGSWLLPTYFKDTLKVETPEHWYTTNNITMPTTINKNTWYVVPSVDKVDNNVSIISVAWDEDGEYLSSSRTAKTLAELNAPSTIKRHTAGMLSLGEITVARNNYKVAAIDFSARPRGISVNYKYTAVGDDKGYVLLELYSNENLVGEIRQELDATADFKDIKFDINYTSNSLPTKLKLVFLSSKTGLSMNQEEMNRQVPLKSIDECKEFCKQTGSVLELSNVHLNY